MGGWVEVNCDDKLQGGSHVPSSDLRYPAGILSCSVVHTCMFSFVMCRNKGTPPQRRSKQQELDAVLMACEGGELDPVSRTKVMGGTFTLHAADGCTPALLPRPPPLYTVQVLVACERIYSHAIPNAALHSLKTADSVRGYFTTLEPVQPKRTFPSIPPTQLPQNLSFSEPKLQRSKTSSANRFRVPFSNFSDPRHAQFPVLWKDYTKPGSAGSRKVYQRRRRRSQSTARLS